MLNTSPSSLLKGYFPLIYPKVIVATLLLTLNLVGLSIAQVELTGETEVCPDETYTYILENLPQLECNGVTWTWKSDIAIGGTLPDGVFIGNEVDITFSRMDYDGTTSVTLVATPNCLILDDGTPQSEYEITIGLAGPFTPQTTGSSSISGPTNVFKNTNYNYTLTRNPDIAQEPTLPAGYNWYLNGDFVKKTTTATASIPFNIPTGTYSLRVDPLNKCGEVNEDEISHVLPFIQVVGDCDSEPKIQGPSVVQVCAGASFITLYLDPATMVDPFQYTWEIPDDLLFSVNSIDNSIDVGFGFSGTYTIRARNTEDGCEDVYTNDVTVLVDIEPTGQVAKIGGSNFACIGDPVRFEVSTLSSNDVEWLPSLAYSVTPVPGTNNLQADVTFNLSGNRSVSVELDNGCETVEVSSPFIAVDNEPNVPTCINCPAETCQGAYREYLIEEGAERYVWDLPLDADIIYLNSPLNSNVKIR
ncbi:MAG: hypothetical protein AAFN93_15190 [Bacteroidota bacterium]